MLAEQLSRPADIDESDTYSNLAALYCEIEWLDQIIDIAICTYLEHEGYEGKRWQDIALPKADGIYGTLVEQWSLTPSDRLAVALALAPHLKPQMLDIFFGLNKLYNRPFTEFGGVTSNAFSGFLPTGQTLSFLVCSVDPQLRLEVTDTLSPERPLMAEQMLILEAADESMPAWSGTLSLSDQWLQFLVTGKKVRPEYSAAFPAQVISTPMEYSDLILKNSLMDQMDEILAWLEHGDVLMQEWNLNKKIKPGYRALFYGPPGTGKTLAATLLAKTTEREIYRIDLSMIVSKYIGETEKNLSKVFDAAGYRDWILFFDEADALFGKRTTATTSNDRFANQQTGYLLQRIEEFPGVVILASNLKSNMDDAFTRRFQSIMHFTMPSPAERFQLWTNAFSGSCELDRGIDLMQVAQSYEMSGGSIINVLRYCALSAIRRGSRTVTREELIAGIKQEFRKEAKTVVPLAAT